MVELTMVASHTGRRRMAPEQDFSHFERTSTVSNTLRPGGGDPSIFAPWAEAPRPLEQLLNDLHDPTSSGSHLTVSSHAKGQYVWASGRIHFNTDQATAASKESRCKGALMQFVTNLAPSVLWSFDTTHVENFHSRRVRRCPKSKAINSSSWQVPFFRLVRCLIDVEPV